MLLLDRLLSGRIKHGNIHIIRPNGIETQHGRAEAGWPDITLRILDPSAERRILLNPALGLGECYMDGLVTIDDDDIMGLVLLVQRNNSFEIGGEITVPGPIKQMLNMAMRPLQQLNSLANSRSNVAHHYDLSNDFYRLWLDDDMQYSCAYWPDGVTTLEDAQTAKKAHIAAKLALQPGQRVLDIGCGWGGTALYLNRVADVDVLGITLSVEQLTLARERAAVAGVSNRVKFELIDYRDLAKRERQSFDRIVSIGMFEHVGVPNFETYFRSCANMLRDDGVMLLHTIGRMGSPGSTDAFTRKYIFPGGYIPALSETVAASEKCKFIASDVEMLRVHYGKTIQCWYDRTLTVREKIIAQYNERFYRMWLFYLAGAAGSFFGGGMCNYQIQFIRNRYALPLTRDYISEDEARLKASIR
jgi:cyclopropane-fatty-acyl-phospholipid synthase